jgi:Arc/MetJ-type ribon-helix-helix transcriptional regulator
MATKNYTISMPEEIMAMVDAMARREHRSRSEMIRELVRRDMRPDAGGNVEVLRRMRQLAQEARDPDATDEDIEQALTTAVTEVRRARNSRV